MLILLALSPAAAQAGIGDSLQVDSPKFAQSTVQGYLSFLETRQFGGQHDSVYAVLTGDMDGDGDLDIVSAEEEWGIIYLSEGKGQFYTGQVDCSNPPANVSCFGPSSPRVMSMALGDMDGDGDLDVVAGTQDTGLRIYRNGGRAQMSAGVTFGTGAERTVDLALADFDNDGDLDIAALNFQQQSYILLNDGLGNFHSGPISCGGGLTDPYRCFGGSSVTYSLAIDDFNFDGYLDLVAAQYPETVLFLNTGNASFDSGMAVADGTEEVALGDMDLDGDVDIVSAGWEQYAVYLNNGSGGFYGSGAPPCGDPTVVRCFSDPDGNAYALSVADMNNDGGLDIVVGEFASQVFGENVVYLNDLQGNFTQSVSFGTGTDWTQSIATADVNEDNHLDIVVGNYGQQNVVYLSNGGWNLTPYFGSISHIGLATGRSAQDVAVGDVNGDGNQDIVTIHGMNEGFAYPLNVVYLGDGSGAFDAAREDCTEFRFWGKCFGYYQTNAFNVVLGDANGNGDLEIVSSSTSAGGTDNIIYLANWGNFYYGPTPCPSIDSGYRCFGHSAYVSYNLAMGDLDGDHDLDVVAGKGGAAGQTTAYRNDGLGNYDWAGSTQSFGAACLGEANVALGDLDGDGDLDILAGCLGSLDSHIYINDGAGNFDDPAAEHALMGSDTYAVAIADFNGDGLNDIILGKRSSNVIHLNNGLADFNTPGFERVLPSTTSSSIATGDLDGDGDIDIVFNGAMAQDSVYLNDGEANFGWRPHGLSPHFSAASHALGDLNNDGRLDIVAVLADTKKGVTYLNRGTQPRGTLTHAPEVFLDYPGGTAPASFYAATEIFDQPVLTFTYSVKDYESNGLAQVAGYYSLDGGGQWHPAVATTSTITQNLRLGGEVFSHTPASFGVPGTLSSTLSINLPGQTASGLEILGLTISHTQSSRLTASLYAPWPAPGGTEILLFSNVGGDSPGFYNLTLSDWAGNDLSAFSGRTQYPSLDVPKNPGGWFDPRTVFTSVLTISGAPASISDLNINLAGTYYEMDAALTSPAGTTVILYQALCWGSFSNYRMTFDDEATTPWPCPANPPTVPGTYAPLQSLSAFDGENPNGAWTLVITDHYASVNSWGLDIESYSAPITGFYRPAEALAAFDGMPLDTPLTLIITDTAPVPGQEALLQWGYRHFNAMRVFTYGWDIHNSGFLGASNNVRFRLDAYPALDFNYANAPGPYQYPYISTTTYPFRVRGTQVRVVQELLNGTVTETVPVENALVYRLPVGQSGSGVPIGGDAPFRTDIAGYLQGHSQIARGDQLLALAPITSTESYDLYYTNGIPSELGVDAFPVSGGGVQTLTVSAENPLLLFNLDVSLEWDASQDTLYLDQLRANLLQTSRYLYDFTNGQVALGEVHVYQNRDFWDTAHVTILASNRQRPWAVMGGIVVTDTTAPFAPTLSYGPGQVTLGAVWNRYGTPGVSMGEDWSVILAHELSHYLLFLDDVYLGIDPISGQLEPVNTCLGSAMGDLYSDPTNTEFIFDPAFWSANCQDTLANQSTGLPEWEVIRAWYPNLQMPAAINSGPASIPFAFTTVELSSPYTLTAALLDPTFYIAYQNGSMASSAARAFLEKPGMRLVNLGAPSGGQNRVVARGAEVGDRLCVFDPTYSQFGCEEIAPHDYALTLRQDESWAPVVTLTPVSSVTLAVSVTLPTSFSGSLYVRLFPDYDLPYTAVPLLPADGAYTAQLALTAPALFGSLQIYVDEAEPRREIILPYAVVGNPGYTRSASGGGGYLRGTGYTRSASGGGGSQRAGNAPLLSPDGNLIFFTRNEITFTEGSIFTIQAMAGLPGFPPGRYLVGQAYRIIASPGITLPEGSVSIQYLQSDVSAVGALESDLALYYCHRCDGTDWQELNTILDDYFNLASAPSQGAGIYALMASIRVPLVGPAWNIFSYPLRDTRPVTTALASIQGQYSTVYGYTPGAAQPWQVYDATVPPAFDPVVNTLRSLSFGSGYWIYITATQPITAYLGGPAGLTHLATAASIAPPPATYYGVVQADTGLEPAPGQLLQAWVGDSLCGQTRTTALDEQVVYSLQVFADGVESPGCGSAAASMRFTLDGALLLDGVIWENTSAHRLDFGWAAVITLFLPILVH